MARTILFFKWAAKPPLHGSHHPGTRNTRDHTHKPNAVGRRRLPSEWHADLPRLRRRSCPPGIEYDTWDARSMPACCPSKWRARLGDSRPPGTSATPHLCANIEVRHTASAVRLTRPGRRKPTRLPPNSAVHVLRRRLIDRLVLAAARARLVVALRSFDLRIVSGLPAMAADQATNVTHGAPPSATHEAMMHPLRRSRYGPWELGRLRPWVQSLARPWSW